MTTAPARTDKSPSGSRLLALAASTAALAAAASIAHAGQVLEINDDSLTTYVPSPAAGPQGVRPG